MNQDVTDGVLRANPEKTFEIKQDELAKKLLLELGLAGKFINDQQCRTQLITHNKHQTHFIVAAFFTGRTLATDNGYLVYCLPHKQFPKERIAGLLQVLGKSHDRVESIVTIDGNSATN